MADDTSSNQSGSCCGCRGHRHARKVDPVCDSDITTDEFYEVGAGCLLRVQHFNRKPRSESFVSQYAAYINCVSGGVPFRQRKGSDSSIASRLAAKRRQRQINRSQINKISAIESQITLESSNESQPNEPSLTAGSSTSLNQIEAINSENQAFNSTAENNVLNIKQGAVNKTEDQNDSNNIVPSSAKHLNVPQNDLDREVKGQVSSQNPRVLNNQHFNKAKDSRVCDTEDTVIFFIHGVGGSSDIWHAQIEFFRKEGYEVVAPDIIGHGMSSAPSDPKVYHFQSIMKNLFAIFDRYSNRHNVIVGHSYGTSFAAVLARRRSQWVDKLIMINGGGPDPLKPQPGLFNCHTCFLSCIKPCLMYGFHRSAFHDTKKSYVSKEKSFDIPSYVLRYLMKGQDWPDGGVEYHQWITVPTLLIYGIEDQLVDIDQELHMFNTIYGSRLELIEKAGHMVMIEQPESTSLLIQDFLIQGKADKSPRSETHSPTQRPAASRRRSSLSPYSSTFHKF